MSKSPYVGYSIKDVKQAEATMWYIQVGRQFFEYESKCLWDKEEAEHLYGTLRDGLQHMMKTGDAKERQEARDILLHFRLLPLRFV